MRKITIRLNAIFLSALILLAGMLSGSAQPSWDSLKADKSTFQVSVWFRAQDVDRYLTNATGLDSAVNWCQQYGITKVNLEAYGRGLFANSNTLVQAKARFLKEGFEVASGVTTEDGPDNFNQLHCYTKKNKQEELQRMFEYAASMFDEIVIDDWFFSNCQCDECNAARGTGTWSKYYSDLMFKVGQERVLQPAHAINPKVKIILKFPQWNDEYQLRGYDVVREPKIFDGLWAGTEARNFNYDTSPGYEIGYNAYFNLRWLANFGHVGGGWITSADGRTQVPTYIEQARHTVLGGVNQMILWCYGQHLGATNQMNALSAELPGLVKLAKIVQGKPIKGVHLLKPGNSAPRDESWVCSYLGNLGIPFVPAGQLDDHALAAVFPAQAMASPHFPAALQWILRRGTPVVITDGLARQLAAYPAILKDKNLAVLPVGGASKTLLKMTQAQMKPYRDRLLAPFGLKFDAPARVELYLFGDHTLVVQNINDQAIKATLEFAKISGATKVLSLPETDARSEFLLDGSRLNLQLSAHSLIAIEYQ